MGRISKTILEKAVRDIRTKTPLTKWKNSHDVIVWFENNKQKKMPFNIRHHNFLPQYQTPTSNTSHKLYKGIYGHRRERHKTN